MKFTDIVEKVKAIVFDVDDTFVSSFKAQLKKWQKVAKKLNLVPPDKSIHPTQEEYKALYGKYGLLGVIPKLFGSRIDKEYCKKIAEEVTDYTSFVPLGNVKKLLQILKQSKKKVGIISNGGLETTLKKLKNVHIEPAIFDSIQCDDNTKFKKPDPRVFDETLKKLRLTEKEIIYIGDNIHDYFAAKNKGVYFAAVLTGIVEKKQFMKEMLDEDLIFDSIQDIVTILSPYNTE